MNYVLIHLQNYLYVYNFFLYTIFLDLYFLKSLSKTKINRMMYYLIFSFRLGRLFVNLQNFSKKNFLFLSPGLFIKFFEKKKSFKKNKLIKFLIAKYIRKLFLITNLKTLILIIKNTPTHLLEMLKFINTPIIHKFLNPLNGATVDESETKIKYN